MKSIPLTFVFIISDVQYCSRFSNCVIVNDVLLYRVEKKNRPLSAVRKVPCILQGSVVTRLRCGAIFINRLIKDLLPSLTEKEFQKSVSISPGYMREYWHVFV